MYSRWSPVRTCALPRWRACARKVPRRRGLKRLAASSPSSRPRFPSVAPPSAPRAASHSRRFFRWGTVLPARVPSTGARGGGGRLGPKPGRGTREQLLRDSAMASSMGPFGGLNVCYKYWVGLAQCMVRPPHRHPHRPRRRGRGRAARAPRRRRPFAALLLATTRRSPRSPPRPRVAAQRSAPAPDVCALEREDYMECLHDSKTVRRWRARRSLARRAPSAGLTGAPSVPCPPLARSECAEARHRPRVPQPAEAAGGGARARVRRDGGDRQGALGEDESVCGECACAGRGGRAGQRRDASRGRSEGADAGWSASAGKARTAAEGEERAARFEPSPLPSPVAVGPLRTSPLHTVPTGTHTPATEPHAPKGASRATRRDPARTPDERTSAVRCGG